MMKCIISGGNVKVLAKSIQMLSKIGDEMFVQPFEDCLSFRSVNGTNSAFSDITFHENFFSYYSCENLDENDFLRCKILIRSAMSVFKTPSILDKQVESCHIQLEENAEQLCFILKYKNCVIKTHLLPILDAETIRANYKKSGTANHLRIQPKVMSDVVQNFSQNLIEVTIEVLQEKVLIRNYIDDLSNISHDTRTQLVFGSGEFDEYKVETDTAITFCLKELRAIMHFAEALSQPIDICFDRPGRPVVFVCKSSSVETNLVLATLNPPSNDAASQSTVSTRPNIMPKKAPVKRTSKAKGGLKSLSKKSFTNSNASTTASPNSSQPINSESFGRISDVPDTPFLKTHRNTSKAANSPVVDNRLKEINSAASSPSLLKRKTEEVDNDLDNEDLIQNSPPRRLSKRAKYIFQKCFEATFDPRTLPVDDHVEVEDSGESDNGD